MRRLSFSKTLNPKPVLNEVRLRKYSKTMGILCLTIKKARPESRRKRCQMRREVCVKINTVMIELHHRNYFQTGTTFPLTNKKGRPNSAEIKARR